MKVTGNDIKATAVQMSVSGVRAFQSVVETTPNAGDRNAPADEQSDDSAYSVRISEQARAREQQDFERDQRQDAAAFERRARQEETEFKREQQREAEAFQQEESRKSTAFRRNQQQEAAAFYRKNYEMQGAV